MSVELINITITANRNLNNNLITDNLDQTISLIN